MKRQWSGSAALKALLIVFFAVTIIWPLLRMLTFAVGVDIGRIVTSERFRQSLVHSLVASTVGSLISVGVGMGLAWVVVRTKVWGKHVWTVLFTVPMLIPSVSHGIGLLVLFGMNGVLTRLLHLPGSIYGFAGIVSGSVMYAFPVAFLMIVDILKYEDSTPYEAAAVLGVSKARQFTAITLPYLRKPMISVFFAVFTMIVTDYGVPLTIGGQYMTLPTMMYYDVVEQLDFGKGATIGLVLLAPAVVAFLLDTLNKDRGNLNFGTKPFVLAENRRRDRLALGTCILVGLAVLLPIIAFVVLAFVRSYPVDMSLTLRHVERALQMRMGEYLANSLWISAVVAVGGTAVATLAAYLTARARTKASRLLHLIAITSIAIPGIVLGLAFVLCFRSSFIYNTVFIVLLVNLIHFFASPYLMMYNTFGKLNEKLEEVGQTLGIPRWRIVLQVLLPQAKGTLAEMLSYFFVNSMITISAVSFLYTVSSKPVALMIPVFEKNMMLECAAFLSLVILLTNLLLKAAISQYKRYLRQQENRDARPGKKMARSEGTTIEVA